VLRRIDMPKVGTKEYGYGEKGKAAAAAESARTGTPVVSKYKEGRTVSGKKDLPKKPMQGPRKPPRGKRRKDILEQEINLPLLGDVTIGAGPTDDFKGAKVGLTKTFKEGGVVYANARGGRSATQGTKYRS
jgi:hypothetical protein